jgi:ELWxxDGT repeat protein
MDTAITPKAIWHRSNFLYLRQISVFMRPLFSTLSLLVTITFSFAQGPLNLLKNIETKDQSYHSQRRDFEATSTTLYFTAINAIHGLELWKTDGTVQGTGIVKDITPGPDWSDITQLRAVGNLLYFRVKTNLWVTDGTAEGTVKLSDEGHCEIHGVLNDLVIFRTGPRIAMWTTDGTVEGRKKLQINPGGSSDIQSVGGIMKGHLYFSANDGTHGPRRQKKSFHRPSRPPPGE